MNLEIVRLSQLLTGSKPIGFAPDLDRKLRKVTKMLGRNTVGENVCQIPELVTQTQSISIHLSVYWFRPTSPMVVAYFSYSLTVVMLYESLFQLLCVSTAIWLKKT